MLALNGRSYLNLNPRPKIVISSILSALLFSTQAAEKTNELKKVAGEGGSSWGGWLTGWTSWYGYEGIDEKGSADQTPSKIKFEGPVSAGKNLLPYPNFNKKCQRMQVIIITPNV